MRTIYLLLAVIGVVMAQDSFETCVALSPSSASHGFVCLEASSPNFLECHLDELVAVVKSCPAGTACGAAVGIFGIDNPCVPVVGQQPNVTCGNGVIDDGEQCEIDGVGCSDTCVCQSGFQPQTPITIDCVAIITGPVCGNGIVEVGEQCEVDGLGCNSDCICDTGFFPQTPAAVNCLENVSLCGNGVIDEGEQCDGGVGCDVFCFCEAGFQPQTPITIDCAAIITGPVCGNGIVEVGEQCEVDGLGCNSECICDTGFFPQTPAAVNCLENVSLCGNGVIDEGEQCDGGVGCDVLCFCEAGFQPQTPISTDCELIPVVVINCGNGVIDDGEQCEIGGIGCSDTCICESGFQPQTPIDIDCELIPVVQPICGNDIVEVGEECEVGGLGCDDFCFCEAGFLPQTPAALDCVAIITGPVCGNGIVEVGEQCEIGGVGCTDQCLCDVGFTVDSPAGFDCVVPVTVPTNLLELCDFFTSSIEESGFVCLEANATEFLRCHLLELVAFMMPCPAGTRCRAPVDTFVIAGPCLWEDQSIAAFEGVFVESASRVQATASSSSVVVGTGIALEPNATVLCHLFGKPGFFCSAAFGVNESDRSFVQCGVNGSFAGELQCAPGTVCGASNFTIDNPCNVTLGSNPRCGDRVIAAGEECDRGNGCNNHCRCESPFVPFFPARESCQLNFTEVCRATNETEFFCPSKFNAANSSVFVRCSPTGPVVVQQCPAGTFCQADGLTRLNPCKFVQPVCGNGIAETLEQCDGGIGCNTNCKCREGFAPTTPASEDCVRVIIGQPGGANFTEQCKEAGQQGFFCVENATSGNETFVFCGANGTFAGTFECPAGTVCSAVNFTIFNPCTFPPRCGDGVIDEDKGEECDSGEGCNASCRCKAGFASIGEADCRLVNATAICLEAGIDGSHTKAICVEGLDEQFLICPATGSGDPQFAQCPDGTVCPARAQPQSSSPCVATP